MYKAESEREGKESNISTQPIFTWIHRQSPGLGLTFSMAKEKTWVLAGRSSFRSPNPNPIQSHQGHTKFWLNPQWQMWIWQPPRVADAAFDHPQSKNFLVSTS